MEQPDNQRILPIQDINNLVGQQPKESKALPKGQGQAHSKIILMGEHAVVYDYPAIAMPFPAAQAFVEVTASSLEFSTISCEIFTGVLNDAPNALDNLQKAIELTMLSLKLEYRPIHIEITSQIPTGRGMGSSAAVTVALIRALVDFYGVKINQTQLIYLVNEAEMIAHEATSGLDSLLTSSAHSYIYRKSQTPLPFNLQLPAHLVVADSQQEGQTKHAIIKVMKLKDRKPDFVRGVMNAIGECVEQAVLAIEKQDVSELGRLMTYNHYYLNQLEISNPLLDKIINSAWLAGALGAKLTGGGLGGCVIALAESEAAAQQIAQTMRKAGASRTWQVDLANL